MYYLLGIFVAISIAGIIGCVFLGLDSWRAHKRSKKDLERACNLEIKIDDMRQEIKELQVRLREAQSQIHKEDLVDDRDVLNAQKEKIIQDINENNKIMSEVTTALQTTNTALVAAKDELLKAQNDAIAVRDENVILSRQRDSLKVEINDLSKELQRMLNITKIIDTDKDNVVWDPILSEKDLKLVRLLHELIIMYPDLEVEFATIEWKKIWMPQLQALGSIIDGKRGIYRLILREGLRDPIKIIRDGEEVLLPVCYIGQATDFKDRWYQHVKKMIGVMSKGNEKVYEWRPENFKWCIVEEGKDIDLNTSERFWIEYFCAKDGLNKKL